MTLICFCTKLGACTQATARQCMAVAAMVGSTAGPCTDGATAALGTAALGTAAAMAVATAAPMGAAGTAAATAVATAADMVAWEGTVGQDTAVDTGAPLDTGATAAAMGEGTAATGLSTEALLEGPHWVVLQVRLPQWLAEDVPGLTFPLCLARLCSTSLRSWPEIHGGAPSCLVDALGPLL